MHKEASITFGAPLRKTRVIIALIIISPWQIISWATQSKRKETSRSRSSLAMMRCEEQEFREAEKLIQNGLAVEPGSAIGKYLLAVVQFAMNRPTEAEKSARDALWRNAHQAEAYILLAKIHERNHNPHAVVAEVARSE